jgi:hypothetical protein
MKAHLIQKKKETESKWLNGTLQKNLIKTQLLMLMMKINNNHKITLKNKNLK